MRALRKGSIPVVTVAQLPATRRLARVPPAGVAFLICGLALLIAPNAPGAPPTTAAVTDLGTLGGSISVAGTINASGEIVGGSTTAGGLSHAYLWAGGSMTD